MSEQEKQSKLLWEEIDALLSLKELSAAQTARRLLNDWLRKHPDDYYSRDGGEEVAMLVEALELLEAEKSAGLIAA